MKPGDNIDCPHCGTNSFLKKESVLDGWTKVGEQLVCSSCNKKIADLNQDKKKNKAEKSAASAKLADFLGGAEKDQIQEITASDEEKRFCRDCQYLVSHPFLTRCDLHKKEVNPMDDCPDFKKKKSEE